MADSIIAVRVEHLLQQCKKEGSKNVILALSRHIDNLPNAKFNTHNNLVSDETIDFQEKQNSFNAKKYNIFHLASIFILGLFLGFITGRHDKCSSIPKKLSFKETVFHKFGSAAAPPILYLHHHLTTDNRNAPAKIFVAAENFDDIIRFNMQISDLFKDLNVVPSVIDVVPKMASTNLFNQFKDAASESDKPLIIINNVNNLKGLSPLTLQRIVDPDTAPSKNATIIFT
uniref:Uncharacterized protein n=1 Tax=Panagrolaimus sp. ES5 TaxID=591445 RepID=A0AC34G257_9BILA